MKLKIPRRDFFETNDTDHEFCNYLRAKGKFILKDIVREIHQLDPKSKIDYNLLYDRIHQWKVQGFIQSFNIATLGGPKFEYSFTEEALKILDRYKTPD